MCLGRPLCLCLTYTRALHRRDQEKEKLEKQMAILREANLDAVETLFDDMTTEDAEMAKLKLVSYMSLGDTRMPLVLAIFHPKGINSGSELTRSNEMDERIAPRCQRLIA